MRPIITFYPLLSIASLAVSDAAYLRANTNKNRELQMTSNLLNAMIVEFVPTLECMAQTAFAESLDPIHIGNETTVAGSARVPYPTGHLVLLGRYEVPLPTGSCQASASATYGLGSIAGLSSFGIHTLQLVPGSETITPVRLGLGGVRWSASLLLNATLDQVEAETSVDLEVATCMDSSGGELTGRNQSVTGISTLDNPSIEIRMTLGGETTNVVRPQETSYLTAAHLEGVRVDLGSVQAGFATSVLDNDIDLTTTLDAFLLNEFVDSWMPAMVDTLNGALDSFLPISLAAPEVEMELNCTR